MKSIFKIPISAAVAAALFAGLSSAHDWYVSGSASWQSQDDSRNSGALTAPFNAGTDGTNPPATIASGTSLGWETEFDDGYAISGEVGKKFKNGLRGAFEVNWAETDIQRHSGFEVGGANVDAADVALLTGSAAPTGTTVGTVLNNGQGQIQNLSAFANAYYDFNRGGVIEPYVGAGVGVTRVEAEYRPSGVAVGKDHDTAFAYQAKAGVTYALNKNWDVFGEYAYRASEDIEMDLDLVPGTIDIENKRQTVGVGLRYRFN